MVASNSSTEEKYFWCVLGGPIEDQGIYENQRPPGIGLNSVKELFPIVVTCKSKADAKVVNDLNTDLAGYMAKNDYVALKSLFRHDLNIRNLLTHCARFQAIVRGAQTGIWAGFNWDSSFDSLVADHKRYPKWKAFGSFADALLFMIDKEPYRSQGRPPAAASKKIAAGAPPPPPPPPPANAPAPPTASERPGTPLRGAAIPPTTPGAARAQSLFSAAPSPNITVNRGGAGKAKEPKHAVDDGAPEGGRAQVILATIGGVEPPQPCPVETTVLSKQFAQMIMAALPDETAGLRELIRPLPCHHPRGEVLTPLTFGEAADRWLDDHDIDPYFYLTILQARIYSVNARAFGNALRAELGWYRDEGEELWGLIRLPTF